MARPSYSDIRPLTSSILTHNDYVLNLGVVPGSGYTHSKEASLKCVHVTLPPVEIEMLNVEVRGFQVAHRGRKKFGSQTFTCEFLVGGDTSLLAYNADSYQLISGWLSAVADTNTGHGQAGKSLIFSGIQGMAGGLGKKLLGGLLPNVINNTKMAYCVDNVTLNVYNTKGDLSLKATIDGVFPVALEGLDFSNGQIDKQCLRVRATFAFDKYEIADILTTKALDLVNKQIDKVAKRLSKKIPPAVKKFSRLI